MEVEQTYALGFGKFVAALKKGFLLSTNKASLGFLIEAPQNERHIKLLLLLFDILDGRLEYWMSQLKISKCVNQLRYRTFNVKNMSKLVSITLIYIIL